MKNIICHLTSVHPVFDTRIFKKECVSLASAGYDITLVACGEQEFQEEIDGVKIISLKIPYSNRLERILKRSLAVYKKALKLNAQIYHLHDPELILIGWLLKRKGKIVIFDSHENIPAQILSKHWIPSFLRQTISFVYSKLESILFKKFDCLVSVTPTLTERLIKINPNTFEITNYPIIDETILNSTPKMNNSIAFAGGITEQWSHKEIIQAIDRIENIVYNLAGNADAKYLNSLRNLPTWQKVNFHGKLPYNEVGKFLNESFAGMALCKYSPNVGGSIGSLGNTKLFEYMMAGLPVIATNFTLWRNIIETNECGICVDPDNVNEISDAINILISDKDKAIEMGLRGRDLVENYYNWKSQESILLEMYRKITSEI